MTQPLLQVHEVTVSYGGLRALADVSITVPEDSFISVIGANGAGKSTLFRTISGATMPSEGSIRFRGTVDFAHIKQHYYESHTTINPSRIVPLGPRVDFAQPHGRERRFTAAE